MRCRPGSLETLAACAGSSLYGYTTDHPASDIGSEGYFTPVSDRLRAGDYIRVTCRRQDGEIAIADLVVKASDRTAVVVAAVGSLPTIEAGGLTFRTTAAQAKPAPAITRTKV